MHDLRHAVTPNLLANTTQHACQSKLKQTFPLSRLPRGVLHQIISFFGAAKRQQTHGGALCWALQQLIAGLHLLLFL
jgi:hypothetical protein